MIRSNVLGQKENQAMIAMMSLKRSEEAAARATLKCSREASAQNVEILIDDFFNSGKAETLTPVHWDALYWILRNRANEIASGWSRQDAEYVATRAETRVQKRSGEAAARALTCLC